MHTNELIGILLVLGTVAAVYITEAVLVVRWMVWRRRGRKGRNILLHKPAIALHISAVLGILCFLYGCLIEPYRLEVTHVALSTDKLSKTSFRIVQISDLHCSTTPRTEKKLVRIINELEPDVIVFTGDALNDPKAKGLFQETLAGLEAPLGKFAVYGNHEMRGKPDPNLYVGTGFELQLADIATVSKDGESIAILGISPGHTHDAAPLLKTIPDDRFTVFLMHFTDMVEMLAGPKLDLYLAGHTHGGQVRLPFYGAIITLQSFGKKYEAGLYHVGPTTLYVSRGLGMEGPPVPPIRFLCRPEITVFEITPAQ